MAARRSVTILGSTGSIGVQTVELLARHEDEFSVLALTGGANAALLAEQARALRARLAVIADESRLDELRLRLADTGIECAAGAAALAEAAGRGADITLSAIVGAAGLAPTLAAIGCGKTVALANKESLVCAGSLMMAAVARAGATLLPVDSEHNAIFQVFDRQRPEGVTRLILTASGGPFRGRERASLAAVTPEQAVAHPNWSMGAKISVDSATMMNKGLELIEAHHLFAMGPDKLDVVIHPQSIIHSMVEYQDGSVLAQMGNPDMRTPIACCLAWPARMPTPVERLDLAALGRLDFADPDPDRFPALGLARQALQSGGAAPTILNAANEVAVAAFLDRRLPFLGIEAVAAETLNALHALAAPPDLDGVAHIDAHARQVAHQTARRMAA